MTISTIGWIVVGLAAWLAVAAVVGVLIGHMIRRRDQQVPTEPVAGPPGGIPAPVGDPDDVRRARLADRGRPRRS